MSKELLYIILFLSTAGAIYLSAQVYQWWSLVRDTRFSRMMRGVLLAACIVSASSYIVGRFAHENALGRALLVYGSVYLGFSSMLVSVLIVKDIVRLLLRKVVHPAWLSVGALVIALGASWYAVANGIALPRVRTVSFQHPDYPGQKPPLMLVQITDTHLGLLEMPGRLVYIVETVNSLKPDAVVITGDLIDRNICESIAHCDLLRGLSAPLGVYAITGNHEYYAGIALFMRILSQTGIIPLRNRAVSLDARVQLVGIDDRTGVLYGERPPPVAELIEHVDRSVPIILLKHQPSLFEKAVEAGVDLQISGHTHNGQIPPAQLVVHLMYEYPNGIGSYKGGFIRTSSGTSTWGPPMRIFSHNEIVVFEISHGQTPALVEMHGRAR